MENIGDMDLYLWNSVLEKFKGILDTENIIQDIDKRPLIKAILDFIGRLLKYGKNKGCCYFIEVKFKYILEV
jgi:hypothetical protein